MLTPDEHAYVMLRDAVRRNGPFKLTSITIRTPIDTMTELARLSEANKTEQRVELGAGTVIAGGKAIPAKNVVFSWQSE